MTKAPVLATAAISIALGVLSFQSLGKPPQPLPTFQVQYVYGGMVPGTSVARAYCPAGWKVTGGGGSKADGGVGISENHPISATDGVLAYDTNAIGWQVAAEDWSDVFAMVVCAKFE